MTCRQAPPPLVKRLHDGRKSSLSAAVTIGPMDRGSNSLSQVCTHLYSSSSGA